VKKDHAARLRAATAAYNEGVAELRRRRDAEVIAAHVEGEMSWQDIAACCEMSIGNVLRISREARSRTT
jgi:hypothetical protein